VGLPILVVLLGAGVAFILVITGEEAGMDQPGERVASVETVTATLGTTEVTVHATGSVLPARAVRLEPQVSGRVVWVSPALRPGGRFREGEVLARIDDRDYRVAVEQQEAALQRAQVALQMEEGRKEIAEREWALLKPERTSERGRQLALREPQLKEAQAQLEAARAALSQALLNVERTVLRAPFHLAVNSENVDVGQVVRPGVPVAEVVGDQVFWIQVPVPMDDLPWLEIPGSQAVVSQELARDRRVLREGRAIDLLPSLEPGGMMAQILVSVEDPLGAEAKDGGSRGASSSVPLLLGTLAHVSLQGIPAMDVYAVPRVVLRRDDSVWLVSDSSTLVMKAVEVVHRGPDTLLIRGDLGEEPRFVTSMIDTPVEGMKLEIPGNGGGVGEQADPEPREARKGRGEGEGP
jgi:RND family efflux transporter MFP subunit